MRKFSKKKGREFWKGFFFRTPKEEHIWKLKEINARIETIKNNIQYVEFKIFELQNNKEISLKDKTKFGRSLLEAVKEWTLGLSEVQRMKAREIYHWRKEHCED